MRKLLDDGLARCLAGTAFLLAWLPLVQAVGSTDWSAGFAAAAPPCSFFVAMALAMFFSQGGLDEADVPVRAVAAASLAACAAGCLVELASGPEILADTAALGLLGFSSTLAGRLWFRRAVRQRAATHAVCVTVGLLLWSCTAFALQRAGMGANLLAAFAGTALSLASSLHTGDAAWSVPERVAGKSEKEGEGTPAGDVGRASAKDAEAGARPSKLLRLTVGRLVIRYVSSFFCLGLLTAAMLTLFVMGMPGPDVGMVAAGLPTGSVLFALLVAVGWAVNREPSFTHTFELTFFVALLAFFPFYPGTIFNQHLSLFLGAAWGTVLAGSALLVSREMQLACASAERNPVGPGLTALAIGLACGTAGMALVICSAWFAQMERGSYPRIMFATTAGACSIVLAYISTNILLRRELLREARLVAQGRFPSIIQAEAPGATPSPADASGLARTSAKPAGAAGGGDGIEARCRDIALRYGCTPREYDLLVVLARGNSMARAQEILVISEGTAITHRRNLYRKLGVSSKQELIDLVHDRER